jgi:hypothetical protein
LVTIEQSPEGYATACKITMLLQNFRNVIVLLLWWSLDWMVTTKAAAFPAASAECDARQDNNKPRILNDEQIATYREDGFIVLKGVLNERLTDGMAETGRAIVDRAAKFPMFFSVIENGLIFNGGGPFDENHTMSSTKIFRDVALYSNIPQIAAELMELDPKTQNLRVLR